VWPGPGFSLLLLLVVMTAGLIAHHRDKARQSRSARRLADLHAHVGTPVTVGIRVGQAPSSIQLFTGTITSVSRRDQRVMFSDLISAASSAPYDNLESANDIARVGVLAHRITWIQPPDGPRIVFS
jgi:hypothetical protein